MVRIGILTSSRADFGVYQPLLEAFNKDYEISYELIVFGTHLSIFHGCTINEIENIGINVRYKISTTLSGDSEEAISTSAALTSLKFSSFWRDHKDDFDIVFCLGDRYEMFSAVIAGIPFGVKFAHFYGGDYSKGVIDNIYRDGMTSASLLHFTSNQKCAVRVSAIKGTKERIHIIGILSIHHLKNLKILSINEFKSEWNIDLSIPSILITFHPETVEVGKNNKYSIVIKNVLEELCKDYQLVITMPNADTAGSIYREKFHSLKTKHPDNIFLIENFGLQSYFTCMNYSILMLGNTSSGVSEAASFKKFFINVGDRQTGRLLGKNIFSVPFEKELILKNVKEIIKRGEYTGKNIYVVDEAIDIISTKIKSLEY